MTTGEHNVISTNPNNVQLPGWQPETNADPYDAVLLGDFLVRITDCPSTITITKDTAGFVSQLFTAYEAIKKGHGSTDATRRTMLTLHMHLQGKTVAQIAEARTGQAWADVGNQASQASVIERTNSVFIKTIQSTPGYEAPKLSVMLAKHQAGEANAVPIPSPDMSEAKKGKRGQQDPTKVLSSRLMHWLLLGFPHLTTDQVGLLGSYMLSEDPLTAQPEAVQTVLQVFDAKIKQADTEIGEYDPAARPQRYGLPEFNSALAVHQGERKLLQELTRQNDDPSLTGFGRLAEYNIYVLPAAKEKLQRDIVQATRRLAVMLSTHEQPETRFKSKYRISLPYYTKDRDNPLPSAQPNV